MRHDITNITVTTQRHVIHNSIFCLCHTILTTSTAKPPDHLRDPLETQMSSLALSMEDTGHEGPGEHTLWGGQPAEEGQQARGKQGVSEEYNNDKQIPSRSSTHHLVSGVTFHLVMSKDLA